MKTNGENMSEKCIIRFSSTIRDVREMNSSFDCASMSICYSGKNRNGSSIKKSVIEAAIPSIYNCPVVCNYDVSADEIGGHDVDFIQSGNTLKMVNLTHPLGVVPESANIYWEDITDEDVVHHYLMTDIILWKRSPAYEKVKRDGITDQSMEITVNKSHYADGYLEIDDFTFTAFCLLGNVEPCFESASIQIFSQTEFGNELSEMLEDFRNNFFKAQLPIGIGMKTKKLLEGGDDRLDQKLKILKKFGVTAEQLDFDIDSMSPDDLEAKLTKDKFSLSAEQMRDEIIRSIEADKIDTEWGCMSRYWYVDYDADLHEIYATSTEDWNLYGFSYSMNGDEIVVDFESKKRKKISIVDFDTGDTSFSYRHAFESAINTSIASKEIALNSAFEKERAVLEEKYSASESTIKSMNNELDKLRKYQAEKIAAERSADEDAVFSMFEDLNGLDAFEELKSNCAALSINEIEEKCYAIRGKNMPQKFAATKRAPRLPVERSGGTTMDEPYGGLFVEFPPNC